MRQSLIVVGVGITTLMLQQIKEQYPDHDITTVDSEEELAKMQKAFGNPTIRFTAPELNPMMNLQIPDLKFHNPWPEPHKSSKRRKKY